MSKPRIFLGSSGKQSKLLQAITRGLEDVADVEPWTTTFDPGRSQFAGGSYVVVQKYLHDLGAWHALPVEEQERAVGRTKLSDLELPNALKPGYSHLALNKIVDESGDEQDHALQDRRMGAEPGMANAGHQSATQITRPAWSSSSRLRRPARHP